MQKKIFILLFLVLSIVSIRAQAVPAGTDRVMILPFENTSGKPEFNWVGESFADSLTDLLKVPSLNVVANEERKVIQQRLNVPLTNLPSLATSLKLARDGQASLLVLGKYNIIPAQGDAAASVNVTVRTIRVNEGRLFAEEFSDGTRMTREINLNDALSNLQTVQGQVAYQLLYQRDKALPFSQNQFVEAANKVPARAFEAYIKGLLTPESDAQQREIFFKNALRIYAEDERTKDQTYPDAALELGHLFLNQRKNQEAVDFFGRVPQSDARYAEAAFYTGLIFWSQENYEQALDVLRPLADDLKLTSVYNTLGAIAVQAARKNKGKADELLKEGVEFLKKVIETAPDDPATRFNYGLALFLSNDFKGAAEQFRPVLANNQTDGEAYYLYAKSLAKTGDANASSFDDKAKEYLKSGNRYAKIETEFQRTGEPEGVNARLVPPSRRDFVSVVLTRKQVTPAAQTPVSQTESQLAQARALYKAGRDDDALAILSRVLVSDPMSAESYLIRGNIQLRRGEREQAVDSLKTALFWNNQLIDAHVALGKIFLEKNDCQQAQSYSRSALAIDAENQEAQSLERLVERCR